MRVLLSPYFLISLGLYVVAKTAKVYTPDLLPVWVNNYFNDLLCTPITLFIILFVIRKIKGDKTILPISAIVLVTIYFSVYFEYYLPMKSTVYTADVLDVIMYTIGALLFYTWQSIYQKNTSQKRIIT